MDLTRGWAPLHYDLLTGHGFIVPSCALETVGVADVVTVFFLELIIVYEGEGFAPEDEGFVDA